MTKARRRTSGRPKSSPRTTRRKRLDIAATALSVAAGVLFIVLAVLHDYGLSSEHEQGTVTAVSFRLGSRGAPGHYLSTVKVDGSSVHVTFDTFTSVGDTVTVYRVGNSYRSDSPRDWGNTGIVVAFGIAISLVIRLLCWGMLEQARWANGPPERES